MIRTCSTSLVRSDGLVEPQPETKANVMEILIRAQLVEAECGTVVDFWSAPAGIPNTRPAPDTTQRQRRRWGHRPTFPKLPPNQAAPPPTRSRSE